MPPLLDWDHGRVEMSHGGGGRAMARLLAALFLPAFDNPALRQGNDQAQLPLPTGGRLALSCDAHVVTPLIFPGGDIGSLAIHGSINDVAMAGADPLWIAASFILEEGLPLSILRRIVLSMGQAAKAAGVPVVTGDTKVVERGKADGMFISTTAVGVVPEGVHLSGDGMRPGDRLLLSGSIGDHGVAVLSCREGLGFETAIVSDSAPLHTLTAAMVRAVPQGLRCLRDPTRGGLASTLHELAAQSGVALRLREEAIPLRPEVSGACELLGLDPLYIANEGKLIACCAPEHAEELLAVMRRHPLGRQAAIIGEVLKGAPGVRMVTRTGGERLVDWLTGEQTPRIC
ncbi:MAG: hydrogenase expression/formation protein HypE [Magnetococcales bacterium]|nr:hydrogenase expression/formation protein HypE [Magnetococcales bacterium]